MKPTETPSTWREDDEARHERIASRIGEALVVGVWIFASGVAFLLMGVAVMGRPTGFLDVLVRVPVGLGVFAGSVAVLVAVGFAARFAWGFLNRGSTNEP